jgi:hypothetical protein
MELTDVAYLKKTLLVVALAFLLCNIYIAVTATIFISHFPAIAANLPHFFKSAQPNLQLGFFLLQELSGFVASILRLVGAVFALNAAWLFLKNNRLYLGNLEYALLFESLYFLMFLPAAINHLVGSMISTSPFLNFYNGVSFLLQVLLVFPALFVLSRKLKNPEDAGSILKWAGIAAPLYVWGLWVKNGLMWVYAISPAQTTPWSFAGAVGFVNSWVTLLVAAALCSVVCITFGQKQKLNVRLAGAAIVLVGIYFVVYDLVSVWDPIYRAFLPLTDFWMISLLLVGVAVLADARRTSKV